MHFPPEKDYWDFIRKTTRREVIESWPKYEVKVYKLETFDTYKKAEEWIRVHDEDAIDIDEKRKVEYKVVKFLDGGTRDCEVVQSSWVVNSK